MNNPMSARECTLAARALVNLSRAGNAEAQALEECWFMYSADIAREINAYFNGDETRRLTPLLLNWTAEMTALKLAGQEPKQ